ncbi:mucin protein [Dickeya ananatis]|uniref:mucin protein n=1 Tax=Dickeya ananatis TaxID=3061286 RepID=UPI001CE682BF|nr:mucin protein [Dickeya zeae]
MTGISQLGTHVPTVGLSPKITVTKSEETGGYNINIDSISVNPDITPESGEEAVRRFQAHIEAQKAGTEPPQSAYVTISEGKPVTVTYGDLSKKVTSTDNPVTTTAGRAVYTPGTSSDGITIQSIPVTTSSEADTPTTQPS